MSGIISRIPYVLNAWIREKKIRVERIFKYSNKIPEIKIFCKTVKSILLYEMRNDVYVYYQAIYIFGTCLTVPVQSQSQGGVNQSARVRRDPPFLALPPQNCWSTRPITRTLLSNPVTRITFFQSYGPLEVLQVLALAVFFFLAR